MNEQDQDKETLKRLGITDGYVIRIGPSAKAAARNREATVRVGTGEGLGGWDEVIEAGPDKGKTVAQLHAEAFNPAVSDLDYFLSRCRHHGIKPPNNGDERRSPERPAVPSVPHTTENLQR